MKKDTFTTTLIPLNEKNLNGRIYTDNENLRQSIEDFNDRQREVHVAYGELGYPDDFDVTTLRRVSHTIENVRVEEGKVVGDIKILNTPNGKQLKEIMENCVIRPRAAGSVDADGKVHISKLYTFDAISSDEDSFNPANESKFKAYREKNELRKSGLPINRIISENDPYGEEIWEE